MASTQDPGLAFLQRLMVHKGRLPARNIDAEKDAGIILRLEQDGFVCRKLRDRMLNGPKFTAVTITQEGRDFLAQGTSCEQPSEPVVSKQRKPR